MAWPAGLQSVAFGANFDQSLENVTWPVSLQNLFFRIFFQSLIEIISKKKLKAYWSCHIFQALQTLTFRSHFNHSLDNVTWPAGLQNVFFGSRFDQGLDNVTWPAGLQSLTFGDRFNQSLDHVELPAGLQSLTFEILSILQDWDVLAGVLDHLAIGEMSLARWTSSSRDITKRLQTEKWAGREFGHLTQMPILPGLGIKMLLLLIWSWSWWWSWWSWCCCCWWW